MQIGGERAKQQAGFTNLATVLVISLFGIYAALLLQFSNAVKPLLVFAATPYGVEGALLVLAIVGSPFGFMAFLGAIVCHVIVLFDFIEEMHEEGEPLEHAVPDAGIERLRPVPITIGAAILALFPLPATEDCSGNRSATRKSAASPRRPSSLSCSSRCSIASPCSV